MENNVNIWHEVIPQWIAACGTVAAVVVALFGNFIRNRLNKPKIKFFCGNDCPYIEKITENFQGQEIDNEVRLRVKIMNEGNVTANYCSLIINSFYKNSEDGRYVRTEFTPKQIKDFNGSIPKQIAPHLEYYFDVFSIQKIDTPREADANGHQRQFYKALILGDGKSLSLKKGMYIIPLKFYSAKTKTIITYLKFFWNSDNLDLDPEHFKFSMITKNEFNNLNIDK